MKTFTGLPSAAYAKIAEETEIPLASVLQLAQELERGASPAYLARYNPELAGGLDEESIRRLETQLRDLLDLEDRRITIITAINQQGRLTPELRETLEGVLDRRALEDLYLPYKPKPRDEADEALDRGLEPLARSLWTQEDPGVDFEAAAREHVDAQKGINSTAEALAGARAIMSRWLAEDAEIRHGLRPLMLEYSELVVTEDPEPPPNVRSRNAKRMNGYHSRLSRVSWRQMMAIRRGVRERGLRYEIHLPEADATSYLLSRLIRDPQSLLVLQFGAVAHRAYHAYIAPAFLNQVSAELDERSDREAAQSFSETLKKTLLAPPAGRVVTLGIEAGRPGGWRGTVVGADGEIVVSCLLGDKDIVPEAAAPEEKKPEPQPQESKEDKAPDSEKAAPEAETKQQSAEPVAAPAQTEAPAEEQPAPADQPKAEENKEAEARQEAAAADEAKAEGQEAEKPATEAEASAPSEAAGAETAAAEVNADAQAAEDTDTGQAEGEAPKANAAETETPPAAETPSEEAPAANTDDDQAASSAEPAPEATAASDEAAEAAEPTPAAEPKPEKPAAPAPKEQKAAQRQPSDKAAKRKQPGKARPPIPTYRIETLIEKYDVKAVVFGGGPRLRDVERRVRSAIRSSGAKDVVWTSVNDSGSWIYATSKQARKELPALEPPQRSAATLARRYQDPLSELVKVDPRVLGLGHAHHDADPRLLRGLLRSTVTECALRVGADLNSASIELLSAIPGVTERLARRIVEHRQKKGRFDTRQDLLKVSGVNQRIFDQIAGFTRVYGGSEPLDTTGIHPKHFGIANKLLELAGATAEEAFADNSKFASIDPETVSIEGANPALIKRILREFQPNVRFPRGVLTPPKPPVPLRGEDEITVGAHLNGVVTNVADFGAFVDIGGDQDGLVHVSRFAEDFVKDPRTVVKQGDLVSVYVVAVENGGKRISLSMRSPEEDRRRAQRGGGRRGGNRQGGRGEGFGGRGGPRRERKGPPVRRTFGPDERAQKRELEKLKDAPLDEKMAALQSRFRTKT